MKAWELFANEPSKWTQGCKARDRYGIPTGVHQDDAVQFCLLGALRKVYAEHKNFCEICTQFREKNPQIDWSEQVLYDWNDDKDRKVEEVIDALKRADL